MKRAACFANVVQAATPISGDAQRPVAVDRGGTGALSGPVLRNFAILR